MPIKFSTSAAIFEWRPACWLRVRGEDAANFLQGQFTNELRGLEPGGAVYGLWLTVKGKVLSDGFVVADPVERGMYWIGSYGTTAAVLQQRLEAYVIADDVTLTDETSGWAGVGLLGLSADESRELRESLRDASGRVIVFRGRRDRDGGVDCVFRRDDGVPARWAELTAGLPQVDATELERRRIRAGVPLVPADIGETDLPNEAGLEDHAISYTKGCYLGQEVMARLKSMGQVRRRLIRVQGSGAAPAGRASLYVGAKAVGEIRSAVADDGGWIGLAMVSLLQATQGATLSLDPIGAVLVQRMDQS
jgi:tRNA-modifying protein YgfZ